MIQNDLENVTIENILLGIREGKILYSDIPAELWSNELIIKEGRKAGIRFSERRGYDVLENNFFVEEFVCKRGYENNLLTNSENFNRGRREDHKEKVYTVFSDFDSYYKFLEGDIYDNACYYTYDFTKYEIDKYSIDIEKINNKSLINYRIENFNLNFSEDELAEYLPLFYIEKDTRGGFLYAPFACVLLMRIKGLAPLRRKIREAHFTQKQVFCKRRRVSARYHACDGEYAEQRIFADPSRSSPLTTVRKKAGKAKTSPAFLVRIKGLEPPRLPNRS